MSATASNENENTTGPDPDRPQPHRVEDAAARYGSAGAAGVPADPEALLEALRRARRNGVAATQGVFALDAGPEPGTDPQRDTEAPLRSRSGGVNTPRSAVPTPLLAAEAARLVDSAHTKRARMVTAIGLPAVFLAATGVAVVPTVANAASASSPSTPTTTSCPPGTAAVANTNGTPKTGSSSTAPSSAPSSPSSKPSSAPIAPGAPQPTSAPSTPKPSAPVTAPSGAPSGTSTPGKPAPTAPVAPTAAQPSSSASTPSSVPSSTPTPTSTPTWWNPLTWLGTTVNQVFNPAPSSSSSSPTVNKLAVQPAANPTSSPTTTPTPIISIGLGGSSSSSPSTPPSSKPSSDPTTVPSTPQPTSSESSKPSTPATAPSSSSSAPSTSASSPSGVPSNITVNGKTYALPAASNCVTAAAPTALREVEWHLNASSLTLNNQHFLGFQQIQTGDGKTVTVMAVHADSIQLTDMVTYNEDGNQRVYSDGGKGKTVSLTNVTLHVLQQKGTLELPLPLGPVTLGPPGEAGTDLASVLAMLALESNISLGPTVMSNVSVDQYTMTSDTLNIPGFNVGLVAPAS